MCCPASTGSGRILSGRTSLSALDSGCTSDSGAGTVLDALATCCLGRLGHGRCLAAALSAALGAVLAAGSPWVRWAPSWALWEISPSWTEGGVRFIRRLRGQVVDPFLSFPSCRLFFCSSAGAAWAAWTCFYYPAGCFIGFLTENIFLKDVRGIRRTAQRTTTSPVGRLGL